MPSEAQPRRLRLAVLPVAMAALLLAASCAPQPSRPYGRASYQRPALAARSGTFAPSWAAGSQPMATLPAQAMDRPAPRRTSPVYPGAPPTEHWYLGSWGGQMFRSDVGSYDAEVRMIAALPRNHQGVCAVIRFPSLGCESVMTCVRGVGYVNMRSTADTGRCSVGTISMSYPADGQVTLESIHFVADPMTRRRERRVENIGTITRQEEVASLTGAEEQRVMAAHRQERFLGAAIPIIVAGEDGRPMSAAIRNASGPVWYFRRQ